jgi:hypothetical protein
MAETNDTAKALPVKPEQVLGQLIEAQRMKMLQAHAVMTCVREVLLYAEGDDAVIYAEAANAAAMLANDAAEGLDSIRLKPVLEGLLHDPSPGNP